MAVPHCGVPPMEGGPARPSRASTSLMKPPVQAMAGRRSSVSKRIADCLDGADDAGDADFVDEDSWLGGETFGVADGEWARIGAAEDFFQLLVGDFFGVDEKLYRLAVEEHCEVVPFVVGDVLFGDD